MQYSNVDLKPLKSNWVLAAESKLEIVVQMERLLTLNSFKHKNGCTNSHRPPKPPTAAYLCTDHHMHNIYLFRQITWEAYFSTIEILLTISIITNPIYP